MICTAIHCNLSISLLLQRAVPCRSICVYGHMCDFCVYNMRLYTATLRHIFREESSWPTGCEVSGRIFRQEARSQDGAWFPAPRRQEPKRR